MGIEREVKLGVWAGFQLPDLGDLAPEVAVVQRPVQTLMAVYHDTPDLRLARWGITLRHRSGDGSRWTVKLPEGDEGPALVVPALGRRATAADVVTHAVASSVTRILSHDPGVRIGDDPEDVHQARVGSRRLRSDLRTFGAILDEAWLTPLREDLRWLAGLLGAVRDADVLDDRLRRQAAGLAQPSAQALAALFSQLAMERDEARAVLVDAMTTPRYVALLDERGAAARAPRFGSRADRSARKVVPKLCRGSVEKAARPGPAAPAGPVAGEASPGAHPSQAGPLRGRGGRPPGREEGQAAGPRSGRSPDRAGRPSGRRRGRGVAAAVDRVGRARGPRGGGGAHRSPAS